MFHVLWGSLVVGCLGWSMSGPKFVEDSMVAMPGLVGVQGDPVECLLPILECLPGKVALWPFARVELPGWQLLVELLGVQLHLELESDLDQKPSSRKNENRLAW